MPFEILEHTADIILRVRGHNARELLLAATNGLYAVLGTIETGPDTEKITLSLHAESIDDLLHDWLAEVLYYATTRHRHLQDIRFLDLSDTTLTASAAAAPIDLDRTEFDREVKAVTYHGLAVKRTPEGLTADVVLDI